MEESASSNSGRTTLRLERRRKTERLNWVVDYRICDALLRVLSTSALSQMPPNAMMPPHPPPEPSDDRPRKKNRRPKRNGPGQRTRNRRKAWAEENKRAESNIEALV